MKIETKYNVNDKLHFLYQGKAVLGTVIEIRYEVKSKQVTKTVANKRERINTGEYLQRGAFEYYLMVTSGVSRPITVRHDELFRNKEELIASL